jgi:thioredoxin-like negative regulator of GroEL
VSISPVCRHVKFVAVGSPDIVERLGFNAMQLPTVLCVHNGNSVVTYTGVVLESKLIEWVLQQSAPPMNQLTMSTPEGIDRPINPVFSF